LSLCLRATIDVAKDAIKRCRQLVSLRNEFHAKADRAGGRAHEIIESLFSNPIVRITDVAKRLAVTYPTAKKDIDKLVQAEILFELKDVYPRAFYARKIFDAAYAENA
jgi:Fic family protein